MGIRKRMISFEKEAKTRSKQKKALKSAIKTSNKNALSMELKLK